MQIHVMWAGQHQKLTNHETTLPKNGDDKEMVEMVTMAHAEKMDSQNTCACLFLGQKV